MTAAALATSLPARSGPAEFPHVLAGAVLDGAAARLAAALDRDLLAEAGWDPAARILFLPAQHRLLGRQVCRAEGCDGTVHNDCPGVCYRCFTRLKELGMSAAGITAARQLPAAPAPAGHCAVPDCECKPTVSGAVLCEPHAQQFRGRRVPVPLQQFITAPRVRPLPPLPPCLVLACTRTADGAVGYCNTHYQRWRVAQRERTGIDEQWWQATEPGVAEPGQVNLRALPPLIVVEVLAGLQTRLREGLRLTDVVLRAVGDTLRRQQAASIRDCDPGLAPGKRARSVLRAFARDVRRALADPGSEERVLSSEHPDTLGTRGNLANWRGEAGDAAGAVAAYEDLLADRLRVQGADHPGTLITRNNLARWRGEAGDAPGAVAAYEQLLADQERVLSSEHPHTLATRGNLAHRLGQAGDAPGAVAAYEQLLADQERVLGHDHPFTLTTCHNLAHWQGQADDAVGAAAAFEKVLFDRLRVLGPDHPHTHGTRLKLAYWRQRAGLE